jgi:hypothetical protein
MITDILIELISTLIKKGFELPIYIFMVSQNGNVVAARYEGNPLKETPKVHVFVEHIENNDWKLPINSFFVDSIGNSENIKINSEDFADTLEISENTHLFPTDTSETTH